MAKTNQSARFVSNHFEDHLLGRASCGVSPSYVEILFTFEKYNKEDERQGNKQICVLNQGSESTTVQVLPSGPEPRPLTEG
jgi:hypothetical protein